MAITYRSSVGRPLTIAEIDQNFQELESSIMNALPSGAGAFFVFNDGPEAGLLPPNFKTSQDYWLDTSNGEIHQYDGSSFSLVATLPVGVGGGASDAASLTFDDTGMIEIGGPSVQDALEDTDAALVDHETRIATVESAATPDASAITYSGTVSGANVAAALNQLKTEVDAAGGGGGGAANAAALPQDNTNGRGTTTQDALDNLDTEVDDHEGRIQTLEAGGGGSGSGIYDTLLDFYSPTEIFSPAIKSQIDNVEDQYKNSLQDILWRMDFAIDAGQEAWHGLTGNSGGYQFISNAYSLTHVSTAGRSNLPVAIRDLDQAISGLGTIPGGVDEDGDALTIDYGAYEVFRSKSDGVQVSYQFGADFNITTPSGTSPVTFGMESTHGSSGGKYTWTYDPATDHRLTLDHDGTDLMRFAPVTETITTVGKLFEFVGTGFVRHKIQTGTAGSDPSIDLTNSADNSTWSMRNDSSAANVFVVRHNDGSSTVTPFKIDTAGNATALGSMTATSHPTSSDERIKEHIQDADSQAASDALDAISVKYYEMKDSGKIHNFGLIAQELATVVPEAVHEGDDLSVPAEDLETPWAIDYSALVPLLIKEIQSLRARMAAMEAT